MGGGFCHEGQGMKALVTGASGFIGSHVVRALLRRGYDVRGLVRSTSDLKNLDGVRVELVQGNILQPESLSTAMMECSMVFHAAAIYSHWGYTQAQLMEVAVDGTSNILSAAAKSGVKTVILTSSSVVLGSSTNPVPRDELAEPDLKGEPPYVHAKYEQERRAFADAERLGLRLIAVCPTITVGGPDAGLSESNRMLASYLRDPYKATWLGGCNVVSVEDVAEGHVLVAEKGRPGSRYLLGSENVSWEELHRTLSRLTGLPGPYLTAGHTASYLAATAYELISRVTGEPPPSSRAQAKMVGRYYWYDSGRAGELGYAPKSADKALADAVSYLVASEHIPAHVRSEMKLALEIYSVRRAATPRKDESPAA